MVFLLILVIIIIDFTEKNHKFMNHSLSVKEIMGFYADFVPYLISLLTPITTFIAVVFVTANLAVRTEIIAILSSGVSFKRLMVPYLLFAIIIGLASFAFNGWIIPKANKSRAVFEVAYLKGAYYFSDRDIHFKVGENDYLYLERYSSQYDVGYKITLESFEGTVLKKKLYATQMGWDTLTNKWKLKLWNLREFNETGETYTKGVEMDTAIAVWPSDFANDHMKQETFTLPELSAFIERQQARGADDTLRYIVERYIRYAQPFTVVILTFIGLIVSARKSRGGTGFQIALGFLISFVFIIFFILARASAEAGTMNPLLAVWIPNIIFSFVGLLMYYTVPR